MATFDKVLASIIGLAILAVIVSRNASTSSVIQSVAQGFSQILGVVVSPVTQAAQNSAAGAPQGSAISANSGGGGIGGLLASAAQSALGQPFGTGANASDVVLSLGSILNG